MRSCRERFENGRIIAALRETFLAGICEKTLSGGAGGFRAERGGVVYGRPPCLQWLFLLFDLGMQRALRGCVNRIHKVAQNSPATVRDSLRAPAI